MTQGALETEIVLEFGAIDWFIEAFREGCPPARSEPSRFTIARSAECDAPPPRGVRPAPGDTNLTSPVQFSWEGAKGAVGYNVWLSNQGGRPTPLFNPSHPGELITGTSLTAEVPPESRVTPKLSVTLEAYEFTQLVGALKSMGLDPAYNARVSIRVKDGEGTVAAYASVVDNTTQDPIYVPSQQ